MSVPDLLVAGSLTVDNVRTASGDLLPPRPGGNVIFAALGARLWSTSVGLVSRAGADFPAAALERLAAPGLDLGGITRVDAPHGMKVAFNYAPDGSRVRVFPPEIMQSIPLAERGRFTDYTAAGLEARFAVYAEARPVVILRGSGGWADKIEGVLHRGRFLDERETIEIAFADTPEEAVDRAFELAVDTTRTAVADRP